MALSAVVKGKTGEQELARDLNVIFLKVMKEVGLPQPTRPPVQRNQNQSAVGGKDLIVGGLPIAIEVKRCETLSVEAWWKQCVDAAARNGEFPILIYRQNNKKWHVVMYVNVAVTVTQSVCVRGTISYDSFIAWFYAYLRHNLSTGWVPKL